MNGGLAANSFARGDTWTSQTADRVISFPDGNFASAPDIAIDGNNNVYVVWPERISADVDSVAVHFGKKPSGDSQFSSETADYQASMGHRSTEMAAIAIAPDNSIHVVYEGANDVGGSFKRAVYYTRSTDGGDSWSGWTNEVYVDLNAYDDTFCTDPVITATSTGALAVVYTNWDLVHDYTLPRVSLSTDNGNTWSGNTSAEVVSHWLAGSDARPAYTPFICVSAGDTLHVVWKEDCYDIGGSSGYYESMYSRGDVLAGTGGGCQYIIGDANGNGAFNGLDVVYSVAYFKGGTQPPYSCECTPGSTWFVSGDVNNSCNFNGLDVSYMVTYFKGGQAPNPCADCPPAK